MFGWNEVKLFMKSLSKFTPRLTPRANSHREQIHTAKKAFLKHVHETIAEGCDSSTEVLYLEIKGYYAWKQDVPVVRYRHRLCDFCDEYSEQLRAK